LELGKRTLKQGQRFQLAFLGQQDQTDGFADAADANALLGVLQRLRRCRAASFPSLAAARATG
jgi:hypothetical protein